MRRAQLSGENGMVSQCWMRTVGFCFLYFHLIFSTFTSV